MKFSLPVTGRERGRRAGRAAPQCKAQYGAPYAQLRPDCSLRTSPVSTRLAGPPLRSSSTRSHGTLGFEFMETPNVPKALAPAGFDVTTTLFSCRGALRPSAQSGMAVWQGPVFISRARSASDISITSASRVPRGRGGDADRGLSVGDQVVLPPVERNRTGSDLGFHSGFRVEAIQQASGRRSESFPVSTAIFSIHDRCGREHTTSRGHKIPNRNCTAIGFWSTAAGVGSISCVRQSAARKTGFHALLRHP